MLLEAPGRLGLEAGHLTQDLLEVARLGRARDQPEPALGPAWYRRALGFASWRPQILLGRLVPVLHGLCRPAAVRPPGRPGPG